MMSLMGRKAHEQAHGHSNITFLWELWHWPLQRWNNCQSSNREAFVSRVSRIIEKEMESRKRRLQNKDRIPSCSRTACFVQLSRSIKCYKWKTFEHIYTRASFWFEKCRGLRHGRCFSLKSAGDIDGTDRTCHWPMALSASAITMSMARNGIVYGLWNENVKTCLKQAASGYRTMQWENLPQTLRDMPATDASTHRF